MLPEAEMVELKERVNAAMSFEGMTTVHGLVLMDALVTETLRNISDGAFVEFGTYKGRTAALFAHHLQDRRWLHAVDQANYLQYDRLRQISEKITWHKARSEEFCARELPLCLGSMPIIVTHHDASHFFENVKTELQLTAPYVDKRGLMILDDFNDPYLQVRAAYYYLRYAKQLPWEILLIGFNKCVLVHEEYFDGYERFVLSDLLNMLRGYGSNCALCRTDVHPRSRAFSIRLKGAPTEDDFYGRNTFGDRFYRPASQARKASASSIEN
jgi:hypothetical protein